MEAKKNGKGREIDRRTFIKYTGLVGGAAAIGLFPLNTATGKLAEIKIGQIYPLSGPLSIIGRWMAAGSRLAVDKINAKGGIKSLGGAKLQLLDGDSQGRPEIGMSEAEKLIGSGCIVLTGSFQSSVGLAASEVAQRFGTPFICTIGVADEITSRGYKYVFRLQQNVTGIGRDYDEFIAWLEKKTGEGIRTTVNIHENTLFGKGMADSLKKNLGKHSNLKIIKEISYPYTAKDLSSEILQIKSLKPDIITPTSYQQDGILMTRTLYEQRVDLKGIIACSSAGHFGKQIIDNLGLIQNYVYCTESWENHLHPQYNEIKRDYEKIAKDMWNPYSSTAYDAVQIVADALERSGSINKDKIRDAISSSDSVVATTFCDPPTMKFGPDGQNLSAKFAVTQCQDQKDFVIWPNRIKERDPIFPVPKWKDRKM